jgi:glucose-1-phosphate adenylyltransferase
MRTRAVILAGGEGSRLGTLTAKRTKPAVPFAGKYRVIDFTLSNCVNSNIFDIMILVQYRPHSLIEHIGAGGPWDLNRDFTGGVRIYTPYKARNSSEWYLGTADAVQQNFLFIKQGRPDLVLILSGDHIYQMNYLEMINFHRSRDADLTIATIEVPLSEASRFGILQFDENQRIQSFIEKPADPTSNQANMGVYLFNLDVLNNALWEDHARGDSSHDFGKDILPRLIYNQDRKVYAYPYRGYWVDVGTVASYWQAHMDLLKDPPLMNLNDRSWVIHTRTAERPPVRIASGAQIVDSMITDGCEIAAGALVERSILGPGVQVAASAVVRQSIILADTIIEAGAVLERVITDKRVQIDQSARIGRLDGEGEPLLTMIGKNSHVPSGLTIEPGAVIGPDVIPSDFSTTLVRGKDYIETRRMPNEI